MAMNRVLNLHHETTVNTAEESAIIGRNADRSAFIDGKHWQFSRPIPNAIGILGSESMPVRVTLTEIDGEADHGKVDEAGRHLAVVLLNRKPYVQ
jgi:hypothetical protein